MVILPIGSGKGGVGKSLLAANLSIALAEAGRRVVLVDLDLGASNAHTMLGMRAVSRGIGTFLSGSRTRFEDIVMPTDYEGLSFVAGDAEVPGVATLKPVQKRRLVRCLEALPADCLVLDLGPGTGANALDFFLLGSGGIIVTTPGLTSILNSYLFLKNVVFRLLYAGAERQSRAYAALEAARKQGGEGLQRASVPRILEQIAREDPRSHEKITALLQGLRPRLVMNMLEDPADADKAEKLRRSARDHLGIELAHLGAIFRDELQAVALGSRIPILRYKPGSVLSRSVYRIAERILATRDSGAPWREGAAEEPEDQAEGLPGVEAEAQADFQAMRRDIEDLLHSGALTMADLVDAVRGQQVELGALRTENAQLRARLDRAFRDGARP
jgi:flagellar biosynthesis protein FlhG